MRLHRLHFQSFAAIRQMELTFGPGLNVLYGPNDLGKSTLADAIRLALLLPHSSAHCELYFPWSGGGDPLVELTFETETQRIWRVRKQFGKGGSAQLQESRNGRDFDDVERARRVDARLREILGWGIPEPGGAGVSKGFPTSFLAMALLSTQANVNDVLDGSLRNDLATTGKDRIAAALQAVAQDPLFSAMLREAQGRWDEAYTDRGAKKTARGSVFKIAAERVREAQDEKERLEKIVEESEGAQKQYERLVEQRSLREQEHADAAERLATVEQLARQAADRAAAVEQVRVAREAVSRIQTMDQEIAAAEASARELAGRKDRAEQALREAQAAEAAAGEALASTEEAARSAGLDTDLADAVARKDLELRKLAAEQAAQEAGKGIAAAAAAQEQIAAVGRAEEDHRRQEVEAARARKTGEEATEAEQGANDALRRCDLLEHALEMRSLEKQAESAQADLEKGAALQEQLARTSEERSAMAERRVALRVPPAASLAAMRKLERELTSARGALDVGLVTTVIPTARVQLRVRKDGVAAEPVIVAQPVEIEASAEVEFDIADVATVRVRGGRREAQQRAVALQSRWGSEVLPHLDAAGVADLEALETKIGEARDLESRLQLLDADQDSLRQRIAVVAGAGDALHDASLRLAACRREWGDVAPASLAADLDALGPDPGIALRTRRQQATGEAETARTAAREAATARALAEERARSVKASLEKAVAARDDALAEFPAGAAAAAQAAEEALRIAQEEQERLVAELTSLQQRIDEKKQRLEAALAGTRQATETAARAVESARVDLNKTIADHATEEGRLAEIRRLREGEDLAAAERVLQEATERHDALPTPERVVGPDEVNAAKGELARAELALDIVDREVHTAQGALQQVGGAVARDRLKEAISTLEFVEGLERETEADYEAWRLLLETMKAAEAAQESNLGQALAPAIAQSFQALTSQRYQEIRLTSHLGTEGVIVAGEVRPPSRMSVGTREQLSTLYRLCLGEYLQTAIVLDDQLVQSDQMRMEWFRNLLAEKARSFQIVVFTCRPGDYLAPEAMVGKEDGASYFDSQEGLVRAVDLERIYQP